MSGNEDYEALSETRELVKQALHTLKAADSTVIRMDPLFVIEKALDEASDKLLSVMERSRTTGSRS